MKTKRLHKKLILKKESIARMDDIQMNAVRGGLDVLPAQYEVSIDVLGIGCNRAPGTFWCLPLP